MPTILIARRRSRTAAGMAVLALTLAAACGPAVVRAQGPAADGNTYALVDTWRDRPHVVAAGRVASPLDVTALADGRTVILDSRSPHAYLHVMGGGAAALAPLTDNVRWPTRIDAAPDDTVMALSTSSLWQPEVVVVDIAGSVLRRLPLPQFKLIQQYTDVAVGPDGRVYAAENDVTNKDDPEASARIVVLRPDGAVDEIIDLQKWFPVDHTQAGHVHPHLGSIDVGEDGRLFALLSMVPCT